MLELQAKIIVKLRVILGTNTALKLQVKVQQKI